jgi:hypothetical protein
VEGVVLGVGEECCRHAGALRCVWGCVVTWAASRASRMGVVEVGVVGVWGEDLVGRGFAALGVAGEVSAAVGRCAVIVSSSVVGVGVVGAGVGVEFRSRLGGLLGSSS